MVAPHESYYQLMRYSTVDLSVHKKAAGEHDNKEQIDDESS